MRRLVLGVFFFFYLFNTIQANLELFRQDAERTPELEQECKEKTLLIGKVRHEGVY